MTCPVGASDRSPARSAGIGRQQDSFSRGRGYPGTSCWATFTSSLHCYPVESLRLAKKLWHRRLAGGFWAGRPCHSWVAAQGRARGRNGYDPPIVSWTLCCQRGVELLEGGSLPDHIHLCLSIPLKFSVSHAIGLLKGKSAVRIIGSRPLQSIPGRSPSA